MPSSGSCLSGERRRPIGLLLYTHTSPSWYSQAQRSVHGKSLAPSTRQAPKGAVPHSRLALSPQQLADCSLAPKPTGKDTCGTLGEQPRTPKGDLVS